MRGSRTFFVLVALALPACGLVLGIEDGTPRGAFDGGLESGVDASSGDVVVPDTGATETGADAATDAGVDAFVDPCPALHGSTMLHIDGKFCIDRTEVTNAQYTAFLASNPSPASQPSQCTWNTSFVPKAPMGAANVPVGAVNWCDALAYCKYAGKTLCGSHSGAAVSFGSVFNPAGDAWTYACTHGGDGQHPYPYGTTLDTTACNTNTLGPVDVATSPKCEGGYPGLFDMVGNIKEWENSCGPPLDGGVSPRDDQCRRRGGGFNSGVDIDCTYPESDTRDYASPRSGIRCCKY